MMFPAIWLELSHRPHQLIPALTATFTYESLHGQNSCEYRPKVNTQHERCFIWRWSIPKSLPFIRSQLATESLSNTSSKFSSSLGAAASSPAAGVFMGATC